MGMNLERGATTERHGIYEKKNSAESMSRGNTISKTILDESEFPNSSTFGIRMIVCAKKFSIWMTTGALISSAFSAPAAETVAVPELFASFDAFTEGPVFDYTGNLFVSEGTENVYKIEPNGNVEVWLKTDRPNGHKVLPDGTHLLCASGAVLHLNERAQEVSAAIRECKGVPLRSPNDLTLERNGGFYFTDPGGSRGAPVGTVHFVDSDWQCHLVAGGLWVPNGLVLSPDQTKLYVSETVPNRVLWYEVRNGGTLGPVHEFADLPSGPGVVAEPDGLAVDTEGNVYAAHLGMSSVQVLSPSGKLIRTLPAGNFDASNLVFRGPELNQLFITGSIGHRSTTPGRVYRLDLAGTRGVSSLLERNKDSR